jgi:hypothetical protein
MRRGARAALLLMAVVVLGGVLASQASAADEAPRTVTKAYVVSGPQYFTSEGRLKTDSLRSQATLERLAAKARSDGSGVKPMTARAARRVAVAQNAEYGTPSTKVAAAPDDITVEECRDRSELSGRAQGSESRASSASRAAPRGRRTGPRRACGSTPRGTCRSSRARSSTASRRG